MARTPAKKSSAKKTPSKKSAAKPKRSSKTAPAAKKKTAKKAVKKKVVKSTKTKGTTAKAKASKAKIAKTKSTKPKATTAKSKAKPVAKKSSRPSEEITLDRRGDAPRRDDEPKTLEPVIVNGTTLERREKVNRRRQIDPTTCERDYSESEVEFMNAMDEYKRKNGRMFPTCSEVLEVIRELGYAQLNPAEMAARKANEAPAEGDLDSQIEAEANEALELSDEFRSESSYEESQRETELID